MSRVGLACAPGPFEQVPGALDGLDEPSHNAMRLLPDDPAAAAAQFSVGSELLLSVRDDETTFMDGMEALFGNADRSVVSDPLLRHHFFVRMHEGLKHGFGGVAWDNVAWVEPWDVDLSSVRCPVHLWYGEADQSIPLAHGEWLAERLYDTHLVIEPGAGHLWPLGRFRMMLRTITATKCSPPNAAACSRTVWPRHARAAPWKTVIASDAVGTTRTTFTIDESLADQARRLGVNISAAARDGVAAAVRSALVRADRDAYQRSPEKVDDFWTDAEIWGDE